MRTSQKKKSILIGKMSTITTLQSDGQRSNLFGSAGVTVMLALTIGGTAALTPINSRTIHSRRVGMHTAHRSGAGRNEGLLATRLQFRQADSDDALERRQEHVDAVWTRGPWFVGGNSDAADESRPGMTTSMHGEQRQRVVDDYLEFLDRRYNTLHADEKPKEPNFSVWKWLSFPEEQPSVRNSQDDALYVLGVANLASRKLLQKHHLAVLEREDERVGMADEKTVTVNATTIPAFDALPTVGRLSVMSLLVARVVPLFQRISVFRKSLLHFQVQQLRSCARGLSRMVVVGAPRTASTLLRMGGGRRNIIIAATVVSALTVLLLRAVARMIMDQGTLSR